APGLRPLRTVFTEWRRRGRRLDPSRWLAGRGDEYQSIEGRATARLRILLVDAARGTAPPRRCLPGIRNLRSASLCRSGAAYRGRRLECTDEAEWWGRGRPVGVLRRGGRCLEMMVRPGARSDTFSVITGHAEEDCRGIRE